MTLQTLVEGQTLLRDGRYRFLRRIGSGTFAVIMRVLDLQQQRLVAIKCVRQRELNALGEREAATLRRIGEKDEAAACAVVRLLETFEERGHFCLVLELLGAPILDVAKWGSWRHAPPGGARPPNRTLKLFKLKSRRKSAGASPVRAKSLDAVILSPEGARKQEAKKVEKDAVSAPPLSLADVRQVAVHLCGALAFLHDQGLIHADMKPENVVRSDAEATAGSSGASTCSSPVKLVDFGNCLGVDELTAYAQEYAGGGFDVQTVTYRAPEVAAGLLLCSAMDMWSVGCLLLECVSGQPLFTLPAFESSVHDSSDVASVENDDLLRQIESVVTGGLPLDAVCAPYQSAERYSRRAHIPAEVESGAHRETSLQDRLEAAAPGQHHFHDFICRLLDTNPATRVTAKNALFHPFLQAFFPFGMVFAQATTHEIDQEQETAIEAERPAELSRKKRRAEKRAVHDQERGERRARKKALADKSASARSKDLRQALRLIPRDTPRRTSVSPR